MTTVGYTITKIQARILLITGGVWMAWGLYQGGDPLTVAWRAMLGAVMTMWISGHLLRLAAGIITQRMQELEELQAAQMAGGEGNS